MTIVYTVLGIGLNVIVLRDIFHALFHPSESGAISDAVARTVWRAGRFVTPRWPDRLSLAGPLALVLVILTWTALLVLGWALLLFPYLPERFLLSTGMTPDQNDGFVDAVYLSLVTLGTLGYGDITPEASWLRVVAPLEALIGFSLFTASISRIMSIFPVLARRHHLAREIFLLHESASRTGIALDQVGADAYGDILGSFTSQVISIHGDFVQDPVTYYFRTPDREAALDAALPVLAMLARDAASHDAAAVRLHAARLQGAIEGLADHLAETWLDCDEDAGLDEVLDAYAADHLRQIDRASTAWAGAR